MTLATTLTRAIRQHFVDNWSTQTKTVYTNQPATELAEGEVWTRFSVNLGETIHSAGSSSSGVMIQQGRVWLQIFTPSGTGDAQALALIDQFNGLFLHTKLSNGSIQFFTPDVDNNPVETDGYAMVTVSVPFEKTHRY